MIRPTRQLSLSRRRDTIFQFKVFDQDKASEGGYDTSSDAEEKEPYYIKLLSAGNQEVGQLKCSTLQPLKNLSDAIVSEAQPHLLTFFPLLCMIERRALAARELGPTIDYRTT